MAKKDLQATVKRIQELMEQTSNSYRKLVSDKKVHNILVSQQRIMTQVKTEMEKRGGYKKGKLPQSIIDIIETEVPKMCSGMYQDFKNFNTEAKRTEVSELTGNAKRFTFTIAAKPSYEVNVFNQFRKVKQVHQRPLLRKLRAQITKLNKSRGEDTKIKSINSSFLDIGHEEGHSISEQRAREVNRALFEWSSAQKDPQVQKFIQNVSEQTNFVITKNPGDSIDTISVALESKFLNRQKGGSKEKALIQDINKDLQVIVNSFGADFWAGQEGSDSKISKSRKKVLSPLAKSAKKDKNIQSDIKNQKIKDSKSSGKGKKKTNKALAGAVFKDTAPVSTPKFQKNNRQSMFSIMAMINQKLPRVLEKNMNYPRLQNRTGRFLRSVRLTDVGQTRQGFVSFGYTYQTNPYEVFEVGRGKAPWATNDRDPRKLIDASIREVAAEMALGRFYTRRV